MIFEMLLCEGQWTGYSEEEEKTLGLDQLCVLNL